MNIDSYVCEENSHKKKRTRHHKAMTAHVSQNFGRKCICWPPVGHIGTSS